MEVTETPPPLSLPLSDHSGPHCVQCKESGDLGSSPDTVTNQFYDSGQVASLLWASVSLSVKTTLGKLVMLNKCLNN